MIALCTDGTTCAVRATIRALVFAGRPVQLVERGQFLGPRARVHVVRLDAALRTRLQARALEPC